MMGSGTSPPPQPSTPPHTHLLKKKTVLFVLCSIHVKFVIFRLQTLYMDLSYFHTLSLHWTCLAAGYILCTYIQLVILPTTSAKSALNMSHYMLPYTYILLVMLQITHATFTLNLSCCRLHTLYWHSAGHASDYACYIYIKLVMLQVTHSVLTFSWSCFRLHMLHLH